MKRSIIGFCIAVSLWLVDCGLCQTWEIQSHLPFMLWTRDLEFLNDSTVVAVGDSGAISRSTDGGLTWSEQTCPVPSRLRRVKFYNESRGWAVGENGVILRSTDGGLTWFPQSSGAEFTLRSVDFIDEFEGWAVGWEATLLHTSNGGSSWQTRSVDLPEINGDDFISVDFITSEIGWIVGGSLDGFILQTVDGGATWTYTFCTEWLAAVQAINETTMVACGQSGRVVRQSGQDLQLLDVGNSILWDLEFVNESTGYSVGDARIVWRTLDGGLTWELMNLTVGARLDGVAFTDAAHGIAAGQSYTVMVTADSGATWTEVIDGSPAVYRSIDFVDPLNGWCLQANGALMHTTDGGLVWDVVQVIPNNGLQRLRFVSETDGWIVGASGTAYHTTDAGENWVSEVLPSTRTLRDIASFEDHRWISGDVWTLLHSADGGDTWEDQTEPMGSGLYGIDFVDSLYGIAVGNQGTVRVTASGGANWNYQCLGFQTVIRDVDFVTPQFAVAVGDGGLIYSTLNGGSTWTESVYDPDLTFYLVQFLDRWTGWIAGSNGTILSTVDGGDNWDTQETHVRSALLDLIIVSPFAWAVGEHNTILRSTIADDASDPRAPVVNSLTLIAYPNPFNSATTLRYSLPEAGVVQLRVFDVTGRLVDNLVDRVVPAGNHQAVWNADRFASGLYFVNLRYTNNNRTQKLILIK